MVVIDEKKQAANKMVATLVCFILLPGCRLEGQT